MMHNYFRVGGLRQDVPSDFRERMERLLPQLEQGVEECDQLLSYNEVFLARTRSIGVLTKEEAIAYGASGPVLRASGVPEDVRVSEPYSVYDRFDFNVPVGKKGDCWDRYYVRVEEMRESLKIIRQVLAQLPDGPIMAAGVRRIIRPPRGEVYVRTENPRGDFGVFLVSDGTDKPYRVKIRPPSFLNLQAMQAMMRNAYVADVVVILGSVDIVLGEVDR